MEIYLPIAELSLNVFVLIGLGFGVGMMSGLFGVGGGFLLTPILILVGIPPPVAVASGANQVAGASVSGMLAHWQRGNVDLRMGTVLLIGGFAGSGLGVLIFKLLRNLGQIDLTISLCYVLLLGTLGTLMLIESGRSLLKRRRALGTTVTRRGQHRHRWMHRLPYKMRFYRSRLYISALLPLAAGFCVGLMSAIMGVGGGFVMVPAMIYLIGMPTSVVVGTSLFQIIFVTANITFLQAVATQTVDVFLAMLLLVGGVIGAQVGARLGNKLPGEQLRVFMALLVLVVAAHVLLNLTRAPIDIYSIADVGR